MAGVMWFTKTHRCEGSLKAGIPIRHGKKSEFPWDGSIAWRLFRMEWGDDMEWYVQYVADIAYCPFCGKKLEEGE